jgi:hypothetical protein
MVCDTLRNTIPKAVVHCQVKEAKRNLLNRFYAHVGSKAVCLLTYRIYYLAHVVGQWWRRRSRWQGRWGAPFGRDGVAAATCTPGAAWDDMGDGVFSREGK